MELQLQITIRELSGSQALEDKIREKALKLAKLYDQVLSCHVVVDSPERRHHKEQALQLPHPSAHSWRRDRRHPRVGRRSVRVDP
jgi:ribosome-associated translation inhibitor RaiA